MIENFDKLTYERKVDVLVAIHVFGIKDISVRKEEWLDMWIPYYKEFKHYYGYLILSEYSHLLTSAWDIVRKFEYVLLCKDDIGKGKWACVFDKNNHYAWAETEQLAICYAALKAVGFDLQVFLKEEGRI